MFRCKEELIHLPLNKIIIFRTFNIAHRIVDGKLLISPGYMLNYTGTFIWTLIKDDGTSIEQLFNTISKEFEIFDENEKKQLLTDLISFLWELYIRGAILFKVESE